MIPADEPITISQPHLLELNAERLLLSQGADPDIVKTRRPKVYQLAQQAVETGLTLIEPHVWKKMLRVERFRHERFDLEGGFTLQGRLPAEVLAGSERVFIAMGTLGLRLEEAIHADLLLHVVDASSAKAMQQIETVDKVLADLGCKEKNIVTVLNKIDCVEDPAALQVLLGNLPTAMAVSAKAKVGLAELTERIRWFYLKPALHLTLDVRAEAGKLLAFLRKHTEIHSTQYIDSTARIELTVSNDWLGGIRKHAGEYTLVVASDEQAWRALHPERYDEF